MNPLSLLRHAAEGFAIGIANIIPGVSGGTMALIFGIYERLVGALSDGSRAGVEFLRGRFGDGWKGLTAVPWLFLIPLLLGAAAAPFLGAGLLERLLAEHPILMRALFLGLIIGSLPIPWARVRSRTTLRYVLMLAGAAFAYWLSSLSPQTLVQPASWQIFGAAAFAITAMILPGISGSYLLLVLGMYAPTLRALDALDLRFIGIFTAGAVIGLGAFSVLLNWLLKHRHDSTMAVLVGLMIGSLRALWPWQTPAGPGLPLDGDPLWTAILLAVVGLAATWGLSLVELRRERKRLRAE